AVLCWCDGAPSSWLTVKAFEYAEYNVLRKLADLVSDDEAVEQFRAWTDGALRPGVTSAQTMSFLTPLRFDTPLRHNAVPLRIRVIRFPGTTASGFDFGDASTLPVTSRERPLQTLMGWKWILDGTPVEQGAATRANYANSTANGRINFTNEHLAALPNAA